MKLKKAISMKNIYLLLSIITAMCIFALSSQSAMQSSNLSVPITDVVLENTPMVSSGELTPKEESVLHMHLHTAIRKSAHIFMFMLLGFFVAMYSGYFKSKHKFFIASSVCILYGACDEIKQFFIPGRSAQFIDVLIDALGVLAGVFIAMLIWKAIKNKHSKKEAAN